MAAFYEKDIRRPGCDAIIKMHCTFIMELCEPPWAFAMAWVRYTFFKENKIRKIFLYPPSKVDWDMS